MLPIEEDPSRLPLLDEPSPESEEQKESPYDADPMPEKKQQEKDGDLPEVPGMDVNVEQENPSQKGGTAIPLPFLKPQVPAEEPVKETERKLPTIIIDELAPEQQIITPTSGIQKEQRNTVKSAALTTVVEEK